MVKKHEVPDVRMIVVFGIDRGEFNHFFDIKVRLPGLFVGRTRKYQIITTSMKRPFDLSVCLEKKISELKGIFPNPHNSIGCAIRELDIAKSILFKNTFYQTPKCIISSLKEEGLRPESDVYFCVVSNLDELDLLR